MILEKIVRNL